MSGKAKEVIKAINKFNYDTAVIVMMNPSDLSEMSKSDFPDHKFAHAYFIGERAIERGKIIVIHEDSDVKRAVYDFIKEQKERKWRLKELEG